VSRLPIDTHQKHLARIDSCYLASTVAHKRRCLFACTCSGDGRSRGSHAVCVCRHAPHALATEKRDTNTTWPPTAPPMDTTSADMLFSRVSPDAQAARNCRNRTAKEGWHMARTALGDDGRGRQAGVSVRSGMHCVCRAGRSVCEEWNALCSTCRQGCLCRQECL